MASKVQFGVFLSKKAEKNKKRAIITFTVENLKYKA